MRIHALENVQRAIDFLHEKKVPMENIGNHDIVDGNHRIILGLIWTIILRFQVNYQFYFTFFEGLFYLVFGLMSLDHFGLFDQFLVFFLNSFRPKMAHIINDLRKYLFR